MNGPVSPPIVFDEKETALLTKRKVQTLRNDCHLGQGIPYVKLGRSVRYLLTDINAHLQANRIDPEAR